jgi:hypothetical protein
VRSWSLRFVARFALLYGVLLVSAVRLPLYVWIEQALVRLVTPALHSTADTLRSLEIESAAGETPRYRYTVERSGVRRSLGGPIHLHGFVPLLVLALVLATPGLARSKRAHLPAALAIASGLLLAAVMLMSDLTAYERSAFPGSPGPCGGTAVWFDGLHRTAGAGLLPLVLWALAAFWAREDPP